ncbi:MAG: YggT family protein [Alkalibacterium gilvum]|uniref:YggT family protein n=2 Tax=Alkalibacterium gilvum TaxID=1130080 RepID=A0A1H6TZ22_9LACT|nr:YggT family protein [Alkalibacterium sp.]MDN6295067.1 YggT family protein [Alkalibacterium sp.]SEI82507.1 YggT family protein [Alkalibacterium gilvum]HAJ69761.1 YggT family protein [Alkalibacterium sp.]
MLAQILIAMHRLILQGINLYRIALVVYFLLSWMPGAYQSKLGQFLIRICEPYVGIFRQFVPPIGMISLAGIVAFFALRFIEYGVTAVFQLVFNLLI